MRKIICHLEKASAKTAYEKARADYTSAKTAFETATNELHDTQLIAPFDGYVGGSLYNLSFLMRNIRMKATQPVISFHR